MCTFPSLSLCQRKAVGGVIETLGDSDILETVVEGLGAVAEVIVDVAGDLVGVVADAL